MKRLVSLVFLTAAGLFLFWQQDSWLPKLEYWFSSPCQTPITYRVGQIDQEFGITTTEFKNKINQAARIWSDAYGGPLFNYDPRSELSINLVYSQGQQALDEVTALEEGLGTSKISLDQEAKNYEVQLTDFNQRLQEFNRKVAYWNQRQGAPKDVYEQLIAEQEALRAESDRLNQLAQKLNLQVNEYNIQVGEFNQSVGDYNLLMAQKPEAGVYDGSIPKIDIYITISDQELIHTLAHELGHAISLEHVNDPAAIMYAFTSETITPAMIDKQALNQYCDQLTINHYFNLLLDQWQEKRSSR
jgi:hypothetical protein